MVIAPRLSIPGAALLDLSISTPETDDTGTDPTVLISGIFVTSLAALYHFRPRFGRQHPIPICGLRDGVWSETMD